MPTEVVNPYRYPRIEPGNPLAAVKGALTALFIESYAGLILWGLWRLL